MAGRNIVEVLLYGRLADVVGRRLVVDLPEQHRTVAALRAHLTELHPPLGPGLASRRVRACIGDEIVPDNHPVEHGRTVEFFPAVSGG